MGLEKVDIKEAYKTRLTLLFSETKLVNKLLIKSKLDIKSDITGTTIINKLEEANVIVNVGKIGRTKTYIVKI